MNNKLKTATFILLLMVLVLPVIQQGTGIFKPKPLKGQEDPAPYPAFTLKSWFKDEFQVQFNKATEEAVGFRPVLIRAKNQLEYSLFRKANAMGVVVGKDRYLFESDYIRAYTGRDYLGDYFWNWKFDRLKKVTDTLASLGVKLGLVLEPGKATYHPEKIPGRFLTYHSRNSNYQAILRESSARGIPLLDLNHDFASRRRTAPYPLFPKGGIHWSTGGMVVAADTLLGFITKRLDHPVARVVVDKMEMTDSLRDTDGDVAALMNLLIAPSHPQMCYPIFHLTESPEPKPRVLVISDSYFFNLLGAKVPGRAFANEAFWYYNKTIYPDTWSTPTDTSSLDIPKTVEGMDIVLIMVTERFYHHFDWDFTDILYRHYFPKAPKEYRYDFMRDIIRNYVWFDDVQMQADYSGIPMEEKITAHADYLFWLDDQAGKIPHDIGYYRFNILKDPAWMKQIREKAAINRISVDEQVSRDAIWMLGKSKQ